MHARLTTTPDGAGCGRCGPRWALAALFAIGAANISSFAGQVADDITIVGDALAENAAHFRWTVTNHNGPLITSFRAPRHLASSTVEPSGWTAELIQGSTPRNGEVLFTASAPGAGIRPGAKLSFEAHDRRRIRGGRTKRAASVVVGFADGSERTIQGVLCPGEESIISRYIPLIGLGAMFAVFLLVQALRRGRREGRDGDHTPGGDSANDHGE